MDRIQLNLPRMLRSGGLHKAPLCSYVCIATRCISSQPAGLLLFRLLHHDQIHGCENALESALHQAVGALTQHCVRGRRALGRQADELHAAQRHVRAPAPHRRRLEVGQSPVALQRRVPRHVCLLLGEICGLHQLETDALQRFFHFKLGSDIGQAVSFLQHTH